MHDKQRRRDMLAYCLKVLDQAGAEYALWAADWYEKNEPEVMVGLGARMRKEVERRRAAEGVAHAH